MAKNTKMEIDDNKPIKVVGTIRDITNRKLAEEALRSKAKIGIIVLLNNLDAGVLVHKPDSTIIMSTQSHQLIGLSEKELKETHSSTTEWNFL